MIVRPTSAAALAALLWCLGVSAATEVTRADLAAWLAQDTLADPPAAGTTVTADGIDDLAHWIPPGWIDEFRFPEVRVAIQATAVWNPHPVYQAATERFSGEPALGPDGSLVNYTAGQPFSEAQIAAAAPEKAGLMVAWNNIHRWQYTGYRVDELTMSYLGPGGQDGGPLDADGGLNGGGTLDRTLTQSYHRVYLNKLAWKPDDGYRFDAADSDTRLFKDFMEFTDPFNVKGTKFVVERMLDPHADDQVNIYSPTERRVRRFSAKERADSFMGSTGTMDDFEGFSGRVLDYTWTYLGKRRLLNLADVAADVLQTFGPYSRLPDDRWQIRACHVVEVKSVWDGHPYGSRVLFVDAETFAIPLSLVFDHDMRLWKTLQTVFRGPRDPGGGDAALEHSVQSWRGQVNIDRTDNTATVVRALTDTLHPTMAPAEIKRVFSVSSLTSGQ